MNDLDWTIDCCARHMGIWAATPKWIELKLKELKLGIFQPPKVLAQAPSENGRPLYKLDSSGVAIIPIGGPIMKGGGKLGEADSLAIRRSLAAATKDEEVKAIQLVIDSPGGTVAGTEELAAAVADAGKVKPLRAHIDDLGASAAYWVASQAQMITANETAEIGSIGVFALLEDASAKAKAEGIEVTRISSGPFKGAGAYGLPVTDEVKSEVQKQVDEIAAIMVSTIAKGRGKSVKTVQGWADGRTWNASEAMQLGLIDGVMRFDKALDGTRRNIRSRAIRSALCRARLEDAKFCSSQEIDPE